MMGGSPGHEVAEANGSRDLAARADRVQLDYGAPDRYDLVVGSGGQPPPPIADSTSASTCHRATASAQIANGMAARPKSQRSQNLETTRAAIASRSAGRTTTPNSASAAVSCWPVAASAWGATAP